jgi:hypothetical protein
MWRTGPRQNLPKATACERGLVAHRIDRVMLSMVRSIAALFTTSCIGPARCAATVTGSRGLVVLTARAHGRGPLIPRLGHGRCGARRPHAPCAGASVAPRLTMLTLTGGRACNVHADSGRPPKAHRPARSGDHAGDQGRRQRGQRQNEPRIVQGPMEMPPMHRSAALRGRTDIAPMGDGATASRGPTLAREDTVKHSRQAEALP